MKISIYIYSLTAILMLFACNQRVKQKPTPSPKTEEPQPKLRNSVTLARQYCTSCHGFRHHLTAPALVNYSYSETMAYIDGQIRKDSLWLMHREIRLTREEWERIARQIVPGCSFE